MLAAGQNTGKEGLPAGSLAEDKVQGCPCLCRDGQKHADVVTKWQVDFMETADKEHAFAACSHAVESSRFVFGPEPSQFDPSKPTVWLPTSPGVQKLHELLKDAQEPLNVKKDMLCTTMSKNLRWPSSQGPHMSDLGLASGFDIFEASRHAEEVIELWKWICVHIVFGLKVFSYKRFMWIFACSVG